MNTIDKNALLSQIKDEYVENVKGMQDDIFGTEYQDTLDLDDGDDEEEDEEEEGSISSEYNAENIKLPTAQVIQNPKIANQKMKDERTNNSTALMDDIHRLKNLLDEHDIKISDKLKKMINNPNLDTIKLREIRTTLNDLYDTNVISTQLTEWIIQGSRMLCAFFNGDNAIPFTDFKLNLTGYSTRLKKSSVNLNKENMEISHKINKSVGRSSLMVFKWVSLLGLPLLITIGQNHGSHAIADCDKHDDLDSDDERDDETADEEEQSDTSEYESEE